MYIYIYIYIYVYIYIYIYVCMYVYINPMNSLLQRVGLGTIFIVATTLK